MSGEIAFGLELEDDEAENGSRSIENVLAVGKCFSGNLWCTDKFLFKLLTLKEWLKLELRVSMSDEVLNESKTFGVGWFGKNLLDSSLFIERTGVSCGCSC